VCEIVDSTQLKFYKIMAVPMLTYARENWSINLSDKKQAESAKMQFLSSVAGYSRRSRTKYIHVFRIKKIFNLT
jgi:hypothetical protein